MNIAAFLRAHDFVLRKSLGQHFLTDASVLSKILETAAIEPSDHIVEIGPGIGVLTKELLKHAAQVTAIEYDLRLIPLLQEFITETVKPAEVSESQEKIHASNFQYVNILKIGSAASGIPETKLTIVHGDALEIPFPSEPYKIVANIPYHITSPLLRHAFRESEVHPKSMTLLIQREVAEKIVAKKDFGLLTILVSLFGTPKIVKIVPPGAFLPPPKVDSAILHIDCFPKPLASPEIIDEVFRLTKTAFGQKRKMLRNTLGGLEKGMELLAKANIDPTRRPQMLTVEEWIRLARTQV